MKRCCCAPTACMIIVEDQEIEETLATTPLEEAVDRFIDLIYARGGRDNITAILIWREE